MYKLMTVSKNGGAKVFELSGVQIKFVKKCECICSKLCDICKFKSLFHMKLIFLGK